MLKTNRSATDYRPLFPIPTTFRFLNLKNDSINNPLKEGIICPKCGNDIRSLLLVQDNGILACYVCQRTSIRVRQTVSAF
ncbi:MAG: hypothetical protein ACXAC7_04995 [Candidatus Hodarchaeales archaeon]|jgi:hypothetical protein